MPCDAKYPLSHPPPRRAQSHSQEKEGPHWLLTDKIRLAPFPVLPHLLLLRVWLQVPFCSLALSLTSGAVGHRTVPRLATGPSPAARLSLAHSILWTIGGN